MTLSERNIFFKGGILLTLAFLIIFIMETYAVLPAYPEFAAGAERRSGGFIQHILGKLLQSAPYVPLINMAVSAVYALISIVLIYYFFEKTQAPEILFFAFFVISLGFETIRIMVPYILIRKLPSLYLIISSRVLLFGRYFGIFAFFASSVYAAGLKMQKSGTVIFIIAVVTLVIALGVPIDNLSWDSSLSMIHGYASMFRLVEMGIILISTASFFIAAHTRGAKEYIFIGLGSLLVYLGRSILLAADTWAAPFPGLLILAVGTWFICNYLHRIYLWV
jgi:hypothetical protein